MLLFLYTTIRSKLNVIYPKEFGTVLRRSLVKKCLVLNCMSFKQRAESSVFFGRILGHSLNQMETDNWGLRNKGPRCSGLRDLSSRRPWAFSLNSAVAGFNCTHLPALSNCNGALSSGDKILMGLMWS